MTEQNKSCFNCQHLRSQTSGDNFNEPMETEYSCGINGNLCGEDDFVNMSEDEWESISDQGEQYINQYIAEKCTKYTLEDRPEYIY